MQILKRPTLILAEKEDAGERIAEFLGCKSAEGYWWNDDYLVVAARGHLLDMWLRGLRVRSIDELPATEIYYRIRKQDQPKMSLIKKLSEKCNSFIVATDFDREGETIGYNIIRHVWKVEDPSEITRAYFSALTESELRRAFDNLTVMDEALLTQGLARNLADTIVGLNLTKALTLLFKQRYSQLTQGISMGRVQSPLLSYIRSRVGISYRKRCETTVDRWNPTRVYITTDEGDIEIPISPPRNEQIELVKYEEEEEEIKQAESFPNTSDVQSELPFSPEVSMSILESLYLKGFASYPRTRSHFLPMDVIEGLERKMKEHGYMPESFGAEHAEIPEEESRLPHWAITLTEEGIDALARGIIKGREKIVAEYLITKIARAMAPPLRVVTKYAVLNVDGKVERVEWAERCENPEDAIGYHRFAGRPDIELGIYDVKVIRPRKEDISTLYEAYEPSFRVFSNKDLVEWMERHGLGTEATRHTFPVVLRQRNYIDRENLPNQLGEAVATIVDELGLSPELTAEMESRIEKLEKLSDLDDFKSWIIKVTENLLDKLKHGQSEIRFVCPKEHKAILVNTKNGLFMRCEICKRFYKL